MARAIVDAVAHFDEPAVLAEVSSDLGDAMVGRTIESLSDGERLQDRGW